MKIKLSAYNYSADGVQGAERGEITPLPILLEAMMYHDRSMTDFWGRDKPYLKQKTLSWVGNMDKNFNG